MPDERRIHEILHRYAIARVTRIVSLGDAGGFSGSAIWRVGTETGELCLKRWPPQSASEERLTWIHRVVEHVAARGVSFVAVPRRDRLGRSCQFHDGELWELTPWLPGTASYHAAPNETKLRAALRALAEFHAAAESFPNPGLAAAPSPGLIERRDWLRRLLAGEASRWAAEVRAGDWPEFAERARELLAWFPRLAPDVAASLERDAETPVPRLPCLRDVWHDHVLFTDDRVTGLIDWGAMRWETVAGDIARLLGSLVGDDPDGWRVGLEAYEQTRALTENERRLVPCFDHSSVLLSGLNWLRWVYVDGCQFANRDAVLRRLDEILIRLRRPTWRKSAW